jgi:PPOX class probable F420-dependent enzyme
MAASSHRVPGAATRGEPMDIDTAREFLRTHHRAVLATRRGDGSPQLSPVSVGVDADGRVVMSTRETAIKTRNVRRDPRVHLCVVADDWYSEWIWVAGDTTVVSLPDAMEPLIDYYRSVAGEHPDWEDYRAAMQREQRVIWRITLTAAGPDTSG